LRGNEIFDFFSGRFLQREHKMIVAYNDEAPVTSIKNKYKAREMPLEKR
jgi:hypothetical protein